MSLKLMAIGGLVLSFAIADDLVGDLQSVRQYGEGGGDIIIFPSDFGRRCKLTTPLSLLPSPRSAMSLKLIAIGGLVLSFAIADDLVGDLQSVRQYGEGGW
jgi:hypothetical protein